MKTARTLLLVGLLALATALASGCRMAQLPGPPGLPPPPPVPVPGH